MDDITAEKGATIEAMMTRIGGAMSTKHQKAKEQRTKPREDVWILLNGCTQCGRRFRGEPDPLVFKGCRICGAKPSYHHGRCCPAKTAEGGSTNGDRLAWTSMGQAGERDDANNTQITFSGLPFKVRIDANSSATGECVKQIIRGVMQYQTDHTAEVKLITSHGCREKDKQWLAHHTVQEIANEKHITIVVLQSSLGGAPVFDEANSRWDDVCTYRRPGCNIRFRISWAQGGTDK